MRASATLIPCLAAVLSLSPAWLGDARAGAPGRRLAADGTAPQQAPRAGAAANPAPQVPWEILSAQVLLDRAGFSPGEIDGAAGPNLRAAIGAFQRARQLPETGRLDSSVLQALQAESGGEVLVEYTITDADLAGPFVPDISPDLVEQASLPALGYTSPLEMLGERFHSSPNLLRRLSPAATFTAAGEVIRVPNVPPPPASAPGTNGRQAGTNGQAEAVVTVSKAAKTLRVTDPDGRVLFYAPVTVGSEHDPLPIGEWAVTGLHPTPVFYYNPDLFWDADPSHSKAKIPPGPNNPVGVMWIDLTREHYGLHGTPEPSRVGHTASHGCVRLTNWDVARVAALVRKGTRVVFEE